MGDLLAMIADGITRSASVADPVIISDEETPSTLVGESGAMQVIYKEIGMRERQFREDLFYRLSVACIRLPPLRDRVEDIPKMVRHFLGLQSAEMGIPTPPIQKEAMEFLQGQPWPGNVRELENAVRRALLVRPGYPITLSDVHCAMAFSVPGTPKHEPSLAALVRENLGRAARGESLGVYAEMLGILERELFFEAIKLARGNQVQAARWLGISRLTLRHRLRGLGLDGSTLKANLG